MDSCGDGGHRYPWDVDGTCVVTAARLSMQENGDNMRQVNSENVQRTIGLKYTYE